jgi:2,4-dienoyl-CoA reductase-like NADH-dependent reductase (Old Yellow Enzyme family)
MTDGLFTPFTLKHLTLRNRIVSTSHEPSVSPDSAPPFGNLQLYRDEAVPSTSRRSATTSTSRAPR